MARWIDCRLQTGIPSGSKHSYVHFEMPREAENVVLFCTPYMGNPRQNQDTSRHPTRTTPRGYGESAVFCSRKTTPTYSFIEDSSMHGGFPCVLSGFSFCQSRERQKQRVYIRRFRDKTRDVGRFSPPATHTHTHTRGRNFNFWRQS